MKGERFVNEKTVRSTAAKADAIDVNTEQRYTAVSAPMTEAHTSFIVKRGAGVFRDTASEERLLERF